MSDRDDMNFELPEDELADVDISDLEGMSLDELLASTKEDLARVDALMGEDAADGDAPDVPQDAGQKKASGNTMPLFERSSAL